MKYLLTFGIIFKASNLEEANKVALGFFSKESLRKIEITEHPQFSVTELKSA